MASGDLTVAWIERALSPSLGPLTPTQRLRWRLFVAVLLLVVAGLHWRATEAGLMSDDYMQGAMIAGLYPGRGYVPFDLYAFLRPDANAMYVDKGVLPWWSVPEFYGTVLRPLASASLWLDHLLAPGRVRLWHLHSLVWLLAVLVAAGAVLRRVFPLPIAALALALFGLDAGFVSPLAWIANRCVLICAVFGFAAVAVHLDWRARLASVTPPSPAQRRRGPWVEGGLVLLAFAAGEYALAIVAFIGVIELSQPGPLRERARALLPVLVPALAYLAIHRALGYGTSAVEVYADPITSPLRWAGWAASRVPKLACSAFWSIPAATIHVFLHPALAWIGAKLPAHAAPDVYHHAHTELAVVGLGLAALTLGLARPGLHAHERRSLWVLGLGGALGLLPVSVAPAHARLLVLAQLAACPLIAAVVIAWLRMLSQRQLERPVGRRRGLLLSPLAVLVLGLAGPGDVVWSGRYTEHVRGLQTADVAAFTHGDVLGPDLGGRDVIVLNCNSHSVALYGEFMLAANGWPPPASWRTLAMGEFPMAAKRPGANVLELSTIGGGAWLRTPAELFFRREDQPLVAGDRFEYPRMRVEIRADDDGDPTRVRFSFPESIDDPRYLFLISTPEGLRRWPVPPVGGSRAVPFPRLPLELDHSRSRIPPP